MKNKRIIFVGISIFGILLFQCQHEDALAPAAKGPDPVVRGTETISCTNCTPLAVNGATDKNGVPTDFDAFSVPKGVWYHDKSHSNVMWETQYKQFGSLLTGRFNYFVIKSLTFDEGVPSNIAFEGYVRLNSVNTGEPGRDAGCLAGNGATSTFKTTTTMTTEPENQATLKSKTGTGRYSTTDDGFFVDADFTFMGITKPVVVKLKYFKSEITDPADPTKKIVTGKFDIGTAYMSGIYAEFEFNALTDFLPGNTNIDDIVKVRIDNLMRIKK